MRSFSSSQAYPFGSLNNTEPQVGRSNVADAFPPLPASILLLTWWAVIAAQSMHNFGHVASAAYLVLTAMIAFIYPRAIPILLAVPLQTPFPGMNFPHPYMTSFVICVLIGCVRRPMRLASLENPLLLLQTSFVALCFVSSVYSSNPEALSLSATQLQGLLFATGLIFFVRSEEDIVWLAKCIAIAGALAFLLAVVHRMAWDSMWLTQKSMAREHFGQKKLLDVYDTTTRYIWAGGDPNFLASGKLLPFGCSLGVALSAKAKSKLFWWCVVVGNILAILGTYSRSAFLVAAFACLVLSSRLRVRSAISMLVILAAGGVGIILLNPSFLDRILSIRENLVETGGTGRLGASIAGIKYWAAAPWGHGIGSTVVEFAERGMKVHGSHNTYVQVLAEEGIQGFIVFISMISYGLYRLRSGIRATIREPNRRMSAILLGIFAGVIAILIHIATIPVNDLKFVFVALVFGDSYCRAIRTRGV